MLLHIHIRFIIIEIESDERKARRADGLEHRGEEIVQVCALCVARDKGQFPEVSELDVLEEVRVINCPHDS